MEFNPGDVIHAQVTKANLLQEAGLKLEQRHGHIYVRKIDGLFKRRGVPVQAGDQLLTFNGKDVKEYRDLNEIKKLIKEELKIFISFMRIDPDDSSQGTDSDYEPEPEVVEEYVEHEEEEEYAQLEYYKVQPGDIMMLQDLQAKPELNGKKVKVLHEADKPGRWQVQVKDTGAVMSVAAEKLVPLDDDEEEEDSEEELLRLDNGSSEEELLRLDNGSTSGHGGVEPGMMMKLFKIKKKAKMNGTLVKVLRKSGKPGRWDVEIVDTQQVLSIAGDNLRHA
jgi:hypothetical protein